MYGKQPQNEVKKHPRTTPRFQHRLMPEQGGETPQAPLLHEWSKGLWAETAGLLIKVAGIQDGTEGG